MPHCSSMSFGTPFFISKLKFPYDKYSVDKVWTKIYCHFHFRGMTLSQLKFLQPSVDGKHQFSVFISHVIKTKSRNRSINKFRWLQYKQPRQESGLCCSRARYSQKCFTQFYRDLYGDAMLVPIRMGTNMAAGNQQKYLSLSFASNALIYLSRNSKTLK